MEAEEKNRRGFSSGTEDEGYLLRQARAWLHSSDQDVGV
jgi:hypothetical protein